MELLYLIDRSVTSALQTFARKNEKKKLSLYTQRLFLSVMLYFLGTSYAASIGKDNPAFWSDLLYYLFALLVYATIAAVIATILEQLHIFFDKEGAFAPDKTYENGYRCWGDVITTALYLALGVYVLPKISAEGFIEAGLFQLGMLGYLDFVRRRKGPGSKRKKGVRAALKALLERCKDFIPRPLPEGAQGIYTKGEVHE